MPGYRIGRDADERLLESLRAGKHFSPRGFINEAIREMRRPVDDILYENACKEIPTLHLKDY